MAQGNLPTKRTTSLSGSARLSLSVGKSAPNSTTQPSGRHPLRQDWSISYVHRPPGAKVDYEKEIRKVATFGSIESFLHLYSHITPPNELPPVTDILVFESRIKRPGVWEEMRDGGKFTIRLVHPITPLLFENLLLALIADQFEETDHVVGCVLSVRQTEDILSVWVEEENDSVRSGALKSEKAGNGRGRGESRGRRGWEDAVKVRKVGEERQGRRSKFGGGCGEEEDAEKGEEGERVGGPRETSEKGSTGMDTLVQIRGAC
uniref:Translation initiation factor 4E n=1 Tax=Kwoniella dejecticola CBS 10117 TaxID=1296121 RepID=A0A1A6AEU7_9TREE|nr:uncharacterized protein I303_00412 [Kwoniella dejecticola CBS 10117]OBR88595.1 hypothetical protein I303_00412 [Kwoniella dejecticola CBS 10117]